MNDDEHLSAVKVQTQKIIADEMEKLRKLVIFQMKNVRKESKQVLEKVRGIIQGYNALELERRLEVKQMVTDAFADEAISQAVSNRMFTVVQDEMRIMIADYDFHSLISTTMRDKLAADIKPLTAEIYSKILQKMTGRYRREIDIVNELCSSTEREIRHLSQRHGFSEETEKGILKRIDALLLEQEKKIVSRKQLSEVKK